MTPEGFVKKAVEDLLKAEHIRYWRMQSGRVFRGRGNNIKLNAPGTPDFLALPSTVLGWDERWGPTPKAFLDKWVLWIECKAPGKTATAEQLQFADEARNSGEHWLLVDDVGQLQAWLKENRAR